MLFSGSERPSLSPDHNRQSTELAIRKKIFPTYSDLCAKTALYSAVTEGQRVPFLINPLAYLNNHVSVNLNPNTSYCQEGNIVYRPDDILKAEVMEIRAKTLQETTLQATFDKKRTTLARRVLLDIKNGLLNDELAILLQITSLTGVYFDNPSLDFDLDALSLNIDDKDRQLTYFYNDRGGDIQGRWDKGEGSDHKKYLTLPTGEYANLLSMVLMTPILK